MSNRAKILLAVVALAVIAAGAAAWRGAAKPGAPAGGASKGPRTEIIGGPIKELSSASLKVEDPKGKVWTINFAPTTRVQQYGADGKLGLMATSSLAVGLKVRVVGTLQADGTVLARAVTKGNPPPRPGQPAGGIVLVPSPTSTPKK